MFRSTSLVPPSIELARERRNRYAHGLPELSASTPPISTASSVSAWLVDDH